jgi:hypothetical protein
MSNVIKKTTVTCLVLFVFMFTACSVITSLPEKKPSDFGFVFNYGVGAKNQLDTFNGTYTKDMVTEPAIITSLKLSDQEMNEIYSEMKSIEIQRYPNTFAPKSNGRVTPFETYSIEIIVDGGEKSIYWEDKNGSKSKDAVQLRNLFNKIRKIISEKDKYKKLPKAKAGYA